MQAVILAAGMGKRLKELTRNNTKCMVEVNGVTLIERALKILDHKNFSQIIIVVGFQSEKLVDFISTLHIKTKILFVNNDVYCKTNNIYSLLLTKDFLVNEDTLLLESDLIFEESVIDAILDDPRETLALVDKYESWMDGTCMELDENDVIKEFVPGKYLNYAEKDNYYKTVNIYKFSKDFSSNVYIPFLEAYLKAMGMNEYYESVIKLIAMLEKDVIRAKRLTGQMWYEIDDAQDLDSASALFADTEEIRYELLTSRYGGYWRYPKMMDFCYLVNPYFPTPRLIEEIKSNFKELLMGYPSGMRVNAMLAAKNFDVDMKHIVIGNGAAELIKELMHIFKGKRLGIIFPTFEEYNHRFEGEIVAFSSSRDDFSYTVQDLMEFYEGKSLDGLVLINPDNPSGNYICKSDILNLIEWCERRSIKLIVDESFVDFADACEESKVTLIEEQILERFRNLIVVKSISKSYGIPGLRLGILVSRDEEMISILKKSVSIWNINSFGEFFLQILGKYEKEYIKSLGLIKSARADLIQQLGKIDYLKVFPSQANYVMCEVLHGIKSKEIAAKLLRHNILVKDLSSKIGNGKQYLRLAVKTKEENDCLLNCLKTLE